MMASISLSWAYAPYLRSHNSSHNGILHGGNCLVTFNQFIDKDLFNVVKTQWAGNIQKGDKKIPLYNLSVVEILIEKGYPVILDGVEMKSSFSSSFLSQSLHSTNPYISYLANLEQQYLKWEKQSQVLMTQLKNMFDKSVDKANDDTIFGIDSASLSFQEIKIKDSPQHTFKIDIKHGIEECMTWEEPSHEYFVPVYFYKKLKPEFILEQLNTLIGQIKSIPSAPEFDHGQIWKSDLDKYTFESNKSDWRWKKFTP